MRSFGESVTSVIRFSLVDWLFMNIINGKNTGYNNERNTGYNMFPET